MDLLLIHLVALVWLSMAAAWRWTSRGADLLLATAGLVWGNLLATLLLLSAFRSFGSASACLGVSAALGAILAVLAWRFPCVGSNSPPATISPLWRLNVLLALTALAGGSAAAAATFAPFAPSALDETLPRAFLLLGPTGLLPHDPTAVAEALFTLNRSALNAWLLSYQPGLAALSFVNLVGWVVAGIAVYRFSTLLGAAANHALLATLCALAALPVLAQAASLDAQLWTAAALLAAACFVAEYLQHARKSSAVFAGLLAGIAAGSSAGALAAVLLVLAWAVMRRRERMRTAAKYILPGLVFGLLPLLASAVLACRADFSAFAAALPHALGSIASADFVNGASFAGAPVAPTELSVGPGLLGFVCLAAAVLSWRRRDGAALLSWISIGWLGSATLAVWWHPFDAREWVPVILLAAPSVATVAARRALPRPTTWLLGALFLVSAMWSAHEYLWRNAWRPLSALWNSSIALRLPSELSRSLEFHLAQGTPLQFGDASRADANATPEQSHDCFVFPLSASSRQRALAELDFGPSYVLLPFPERATAGVEYLGRAHLGVDARDYFGLHARTDRRVEDRNRNLLITVSPSAARDHVTQLRVDLKGLNPVDAAKLEVIAENADGQRAKLATLATAGSLTVTRPAALARLHFLVRGNVNGAEKGMATLEDRIVGEFVRPAENDPQRILGVELVARTSPAPIEVDAHLLAPDGPYPQWSLPLTRAMRAESIRLLVPGQPGLARLRISLSARLQNRAEGILAISCNGTELRRLAFDEPLTWQHLVVEAPAQGGTNVIELRDLRPPPSPDWSAYLQRYPDVRNHLELTRQPPIEGARIHYESSGRAEGRTVVLIEKPRPAPDALYYLFRSLRVEGLRP